jgi:hypothetical protein
VDVLYGYCYVHASTTVLRDVLYVIGSSRNGSEPQPSPDFAFRRFLSVEGLTIRLTLSITLEPAQFGSRLGSWLIVSSFIQRRRYHAMDRVLPPFVPVTLRHDSYQMSFLLHELS